MTPKFIKTEQVEKRSYKDFLSKAKDFYNGIEVNRNEKLWCVMGLCSVHATISMGDALTANFLGVRSTAQDHRSTKEILERIHIDGINQYLNVYERIIAKKNAVAYDQRYFTEKEAQEIGKQAQRFYEWAVKQLPLL